jgi:hypothetical protein
MVKSFGCVDKDFEAGAEQACGCINYVGPGQDRAAGWIGSADEGIWYTDADGRHLSRADFIKYHGNDPLAQKHIQEGIKKAGLFEIALKEPVA